jgi:tetratricopeptide (TPR) repeat protein
MTALADLDVQQSLKNTIDTLLDAARSVQKQAAGGGANLPGEARATLDLIAKKVGEAEEYFARALDSKELYDVLSAVHRTIADSAGAARYERQGRMFEADELEFKGRMEAFYGNHTKALEYFGAALKLIPDHAFALKGKETSQKRIEKSSKDLEKLKKAADTKRTAKDYLSLGSAQADLGLLEPALKAFEEAAKVDPANPDVWARKGTILHALGKPQEALSMYKKAVEIKPTSMTGRRGVNYATFQLENPSK